MSVGHYENFPVGSILLPKSMRRAVHVIYRFARYADDVADEGDSEAQERLTELSRLEAELGCIEQGGAVSPGMMAELADVIRAYKLPLAPFYDLLSAFKQDVVKTRYHSFAELVDYCRRSANPVGRLMLALYGEQDPRRVAMSDGICTALQLINFLQDVAIDWKKNRIYLPLDDLERFGISEQQIAGGDTSGLWQAMMNKQIERTRGMLQGGAPLGKVLKGRIGLELRMIVMGGERILKKIHQAKGDVFRHRPVLTSRDWVYMLYRAVFVK